MNDAQHTQDLEERMLLMLARHEIEQLRRWYAVATDSLGRQEDNAALAYGRSIYHRIFTPNAQIGVRGGQVDLQGTGPDAWADVASNALAEYTATQHLIGSQVVTFEQVVYEGIPKELTAGSAEMSSYVQAWHAWSQSDVRIVIGTYKDRVRFDPQVGWQIENMVLNYRSGERRPLGDPP